MKRSLRPEEARLWAIVAATVRPAPGRVPPQLPPEPELEPTASSTARSAPSGVRPAHKPAKARLLPATPEGIEPNRRHRIVRGREEIAARLDLHGLDQDRARARLIDFLLTAQADGARAVLVITGKGYAGEGVLRRRAPEWLGDPRLRDVVAGLSHADDRHGGNGAYYVALKRARRAAWRV